MCAPSPSNGVFCFPLLAVEPRISLDDGSEPCRGTAAVRTPLGSRGWEGRVGDRTPLLSAAVDVLLTFDGVVQDVVADDNSRELGEMEVVRRRDER